MGRLQLCLVGSAALGPVAGAHGEEKLLSSGQPESRRERDRETETERQTGKNQKDRETEKSREREQSQGPRVPPRSCSVTSLPPQALLP